MLFLDAIILIQVPSSGIFKKEEKKTPTLM